MQTSSNLVARLGGIAAILGGVLWSASIFFGMNDTVADSDGASDILFATLPLLLLGGMVGLYARCRGRLGEWETLSVSGFATCVVGLAGASVGLFGAVVYDLESSWLAGLSWWTFAFGFFLLNLGLLFFGNSVFQTRTLARWRAMPLAIGATGILVILFPPWSYPGAVLWVLYGLVWVALGLTLLFGESEAARQPASTR